MEWSPTKENMEIRNGTVPSNGKNNEKMGYGNGRIPNNGKNGIPEWEDPEQ